MMLKLRDICIIEDIEELQAIPKGKYIINCINAHSYNIAQKDYTFSKALISSDYLIPDGVSIIMACKWLKAKSRPKKRITGWDLFSLEMNKLHSEVFSGEYQVRQGKGKTPIIMFMGSSEKVLGMIKNRMKEEFPNFAISTYSPPYKKTFSDEDNKAIIHAINNVKPDLLWVGMTAPKQEKWLYEHWNELDIDCHVGCIGAVFDFYAGTIKRAPQWWLDHSLEWLYRLLKEPKRMWKRYLLGNPIFLYNIFKEWIK